jgi:hypothetical protein
MNTNNARFRFTKILCLVGIIGLGLFSIIASGGNDGHSVSEDGTGTITINNYDNKDYEVDLRRVFDHKSLGVLNVDDFNLLDDDWSDSFEDVPKGTYYLKIRRNGKDVDRSSHFSMEKDDVECYRINSHGHLKKC